MNKKLRKWIPLLTLSSALSLANVSLADTLIWDNGGMGQNFNTAGNWSPDQTPISGSDSLIFGSLNATTPTFANTTFTIGSGQTFSTDAGFTFRIGDNAELILGTGGTLDFSTGGNGILAEGGTTNMRLTIEAGATASAYRYFNHAGYTTKFVADAAGVTTFDVTNMLYLNPGVLEVDLTNYNIANGNTLILFDYGSTTINGTGDKQFGTVTLSPDWTGTINYTYDLGGGNKGIALENLNVVPEPSTYALLSLAAAGLGAHVVRRRRNR